MSGQQAAAGGDVPVEDRPDPIDVEVVEGTKSQKCTLRYKYPHMKEDVPKWSKEDSDGGGFYIRFEVKRGQKLIVLKESRKISGQKEDLVVKKQCSKEGEYFEVQLEKKKDIVLADKFRPDSPPL